MKKIVLVGKEEDLLALEARGAVTIRDAGYTEIPSGSLTVAALPPMPRSEAKPLIGHLKTLR